MRDEDPLAWRRPRRDPLDAIELLVDVPREAGGAHLAQQRVQLVDVAVGIDAWIGLADASAIEERGLAAVARSRVDFHVGRLYRRP